MMRFFCDPFKEPNENQDRRTPATAMLIMALALSAAIAGTIAIPTDALAVCEQQRNNYHAWRAASSTKRMYDAFMKDKKCGAYRWDKMVTQVKAPLIRCECASVNSTKEGEENCVNNRTRMRRRPAGCPERN